MALATDRNSNIYVSGVTSYALFPVTPGAYQTVAGGSHDLFVTKLDSTGSSLVYSTLIGGQSDEFPTFMRVNNEGELFLAGYTTSANYPTTPGAYQSILGGNADAFLTKLSPAGSSLSYSTYIGGLLADYGESLAFDNSGKVYLTGETSSENYPVTSGAFQSSDAFMQNSFVTKFDIPITNVAPSNPFPRSFVLDQNYPNPFNPSTVIKYSIPVESNVSIKIYNSLGQNIREYNQGVKQPGFYELNFDASGISSGVYFYSLRAVSKDGGKEFIAVKKMVILK